LKINDLLLEKGWGSHSPGFLMPSESHYNLLMTTRFYILLAVLAVISATIPRTLIDSGNIFIHTGNQQTLNPSAGQVFSFTIGFTKSFSTVPSFAVLLHGASILSDQNTAGFQVLTDTPTLTGVDFNVTNFVGESSTVRMNFVWVAATG
jgi:hypothetical protein